MEGLDPILREKCNSQSKKQQVVILLTCKSIRQHGKNFADLIKIKLSNNPLYHFLEEESDLYHVYKGFLNLNEVLFRNVLSEKGLESLYKGNSALDYLAEYSDSEEEDNNIEGGGQSSAVNRVAKEEATRQITKDNNDVVGASGAAGGAGDSDSISVASSKSINSASDLSISNTNSLHCDVSTTEDILLSITQRKKLERLKRAKSLSLYFSEFIESTNQNDNDIISKVSEEVVGKTISSSLLNESRKRCSVESMNSVEESKKSRRLRLVDSGIDTHGRRKHNTESADNNEDVLNTIELDSKISQIVDNIISTKYKGGMGSLIERAFGIVNAKLLGS
jgi:hypothetical protein